VLSRAKAERHREVNDDETQGDAQMTARDQPTGRRRYTRKPLTLTEPETIPMTEEEREQAMTALLRLIAELMTDPKFISFAETHSTPDENNPASEA
jgi:hypothetical protein